MKQNVDIDHIIEAESGFFVVIRNTRWTKYPKKNAMRNSLIMIFPTQQFIICRLTWSIL